MPKQGRGRNTIGEALVEFGINGAGKDFRVYGGTENKYIEWLSSTDTFNVNGLLKLNGVNIPTENSNDYVYPETFGAKGNGVANDKDAMTEALTYPKVKLTKGKTYYLGGNTSGNGVYFTNDVVFEGEGILKDGIFGFTGAVNVEVRNITFDNVRLAMNDAMGSLKSYWCTYKNTSGNSIALANSINDIEIVDNKFLDVTYRVDEGGNFNSNGSAVYINTTETVGRCIIKDNEMLNIDGGTTVFVKADFTWIDIDSNYMNHLGQRGIGFWETPATSKGIARNNTIKNCGELKDSGVLAGVGCNGIYTNSALVDVDIIGNTVIDVYENGIEGVFRSIKDNYIENTGTDLINYDTPSIEGIYSTSCRNITGNTIKNPAGNGVYCYTDGATFEDINICNNDIRKDVYDVDKSGIVIRGIEGTLVTIKDIKVSNNTVDNFGIAVDLPTVLPTPIYDATYTNVKVGINIATNCGKYFSGSWVIDLTENGTYSDLIANNLFSDGSTLTGWTVQNASVANTLVGNHNIPKVTDVGGLNGRILQNVFMPTSETGNRFIQLEINMRGDGTSKFVRIYSLDVNGANPSSPVSYIFSIKSSSDFNKYTILVPCNGYIQLEIANSGTGEYFEIESIQSKYIDFKV